MGESAAFKVTPVEAMPGAGTSPSAEPADSFRRHAAAERVRLVAYRLTKQPLQLVPAQAKRAWMSATPDAFANRCLPLRIANEAGWFILSDHAVEIVWDGTPALTGIEVRHLSGPRANLPSSHFGAGIVTWRVPYLFRTPPGYHLAVRGPSNWCKDGICALDAIVESDWSTATFTMNWKVTRPNWPVRFEKDEPIAMIAPCRTSELEQVEPLLQPIEENPELEKEHRAWAESRYHFLSTASYGPVKAPWQKHYYAGKTVNGAEAPEHQFSLKLRGFESGS